MSSLLSSTTKVDTSTPIPSHITKTQVLAFLHDTTKMLALNPLISECKPLDAADSVTEFYKTVPAKEKPANMATCKIFHITEDADLRQASSGAWTKTFLPDKVIYTSGMENTPSGMISITHAPLNVTSVTTWVVTGSEGNLVVDMSGKVEANKVLMQFIKRMLPADYQELAKRFLEALKGDVDGVVEKV